VNVSESGGKANGDGDEIGCSVERGAELLLCSPPLFFDILPPFIVAMSKCEYVCMNFQFFPNCQAL
jgi:hypothetical protein